MKTDSTHSLSGIASTSVPGTEQRPLKNEASQQNNTASTSRDTRFEDLQSGNPQITDRHLAQLETALDLSTHFSSHSIDAGTPPTDSQANAAHHTKVSNLIDRNRLFNQNGSICKPTALANLDVFHSQEHGVDNIPLRKDRRGEYGFKEKGLAKDVNRLSVRELAKNVNSAQGELLQAEDLLETARRMGYSASAVKPSGLEDFCKLVHAQLENKQPVLCCFAVNLGTGMPDSCLHEGGANEHACLIVGCDASNQTMDIAHWGTVFNGVKADALYESMNVLPDTREQEIYRPRNNIRPRIHMYHSKYEQIDAAPGSASNATSSSPGLRKSIQPQPGSGFKNTLFLLAPNLKDPRWSSTAATSTS